MKHFTYGYTHNDLEKFDHRGNHLGSADSDTGEVYKPPVPGRNIRGRL